MQNLSVTPASNGTAVVTIDRPERRNACNQAMWRGLAELFTRLREDRSVHAVVLTGAGGHFCAGADISEFADVRDDSAAALEYSKSVSDAEQAIFHFPKPVIAAVSGYAIGGGCGLSLVCDFRVAHTSARFAIPAAKLGIVYSLDECRALATVVGVTRAKRILFTGEQIAAEEAVRIGLVDILTEQDALEAALEFAGRMSGNAPLSIEGAKVALNAVATGEAAARRDEVALISRRAADSADYREGRQAFLEKRKPRFTGS